MIIIQIHQEVYGSLKESDLQLKMLIGMLVVALLILDQYKAAHAGERANAVNNTNISVKNTKTFALLKYLSNF